MGLFGKFMESMLANRARAYAKGTARTMLISALACQSKFEEHSPTGIWCGRQALLTRPYWKRIGETRFTYERSGESVDFPDSMSLRDLIHLIAQVEVSWMLAAGGTDPLQADDVMMLVYQEVSEVLGGLPKV